MSNFEFICFLYKHLISMNLKLWWLLTFQPLKAYGHLIPYLKAPSWEYLDSKDRSASSLLMSVRRSWNVSIYNINGALLILKCSLLYSSPSATAFMSTWRKTYLGHLQFFWVVCIASWDVDHVPKANCFKNGIEFVFK